MRTIAGAGCALGLFAIIAGCSDDAARPDKDLGLDPAPEQFEPWARGLRAACEPGYTGDPAAPAFDPNEAGPHGLVFIAPDGSAHALNNLIPKSWRPQSLSDVELVACVSELRSQTVDVCEYLETSRTVEKVVRIVDIGVRSLRSGETVAFTVSGNSPAVACPEYISLTEKTPDIVGGLPSTEVIRVEVVDRYVPVPECGGERPFASCLQCWLDEAGAGTSGCGGPSKPLSVTTSVRTGEPTTLTWEWQEQPPHFYRDAIGIDWSQSPDVALVDVLDGEVISFTAPQAGTYELVARAVLPATPDGQALETHVYSIDALDPPTAELDVGEEPIVRLGAPAPTETFRALVTGRPESGRLGEVFSFSWAETPAGSQAKPPTIREPERIYWSFAPDLPGSYRAQLEYSDGHGVSVPAVSGPITAIDGPVVSVESEELMGLVGEVMFIRATLSYALDNGGATWTLTERPEGSLADIVGQSLDAELLPDVAGTYVVEVVGFDGGGMSEPVSVTITVE